jgi:glutaredoxin 3
MTEIIMYTTARCPYCVRAKELLTARGLSYKEMRVDNDEELRQDMMQKSGRRTVPQIFINGQSIGGYDDLYELDRTGKLAAML